MQKSHHSALNDIALIRQAVKELQTRVASEAPRASLHAPLKLIEDAVTRVLAWMEPEDQTPALVRHLVPPDKSCGANCLFFPTRVLFVDDHPDFLETTLRRLNLPNRTVIATSALEARSLLRSTSSLLNSLTFSHPRSDETASLTHETLELNFSQSLHVLKDERRFSEIAVVVSDYDMPGEDGIAFFHSIADLPVLKILLTARVDYQIATQAFNEGVIDGFVLKQSAELTEMLHGIIHRSQEKYFSRYSQFLLQAIPIETRELLASEPYQKLFEETRQALHTVEYYLIDTSGSFLLIDAYGKPSWLVVRFEKDFIRMHQIFSACFGEETALKYGTDQRDHLFFFPDDQDMAAASDAWADGVDTLEGYAHPACPLTEGVYYAVITDWHYDRFDQNQVAPFFKE